MLFVYADLCRVRCFLVTTLTATEDITRVRLCVFLVSKKSKEVHEWLRDKSDDGHKQQTNGEMNDDEEENERPREKREKEETMIRLVIERKY